MRHSAKIAAQAHIQAMANTKPGVGEWQLEGIIEGLFRYCNTSGSAYPSIIGSGENATILHYTVNDDTCDDGEVILIDAGCEYNGYASTLLGLGQLMVSSAKHKQKFTKLYWTHN